jgi:AraC-like DNA-binding protein
MKRTCTLIAIFLSNNLPATKLPGNEIHSEIKKRNLSSDIELKPAASIDIQSMLMWTIIILISISIAVIYIHLKSKLKKQDSLFQHLLKLSQNIELESLEIDLENKTRGEKRLLEQPLPDSKHKILLALQKAIKNKVYMNPKCNRSFLAHKLGTNTNYITKVVQWHYGVSLTELLHNLRIKEILMRLHTNKKFRNYSIEYIAMEAGYTGKRTFEVAFKNIVGISPACFIAKLSSVDKAESLNDINNKFICSNPQLAQKIGISIQDHPEL